MTDRTTTTEPLASADARLAALLDRAEISELIDRYIVTLDTAEQADRDIEWYRRIFTENVRLSFPIGDRVGVAGLAEFQRTAKLTWQMTHHVSGNHVIDLDGDLAKVRVQILGNHLEYDVPVTGIDHEHRFDMGGHYEVEAVRTAAGWRLAFLRFVIAWTSGGGKPNADYSSAL